MRVTNFYLEEKYYVGKRVDYYVDYHKRIVDQYFNIRTINSRKEYDIDMENTWWTVMPGSNPHFPTAKSCTEFIQRVPLIAELRCFYEYYYGQYLPTGMQALALAVCLGFDNVYLAGFDLFSDTKDLHVYKAIEQKCVERVRNYERAEYDTPPLQDMSAKSISAHTSKVHPTFMQVELIQLLSKLFPETRLLSVCESSAINEHVLMGEKLTDKPWYHPQGKPENRTTDWYTLPDNMPSSKRAEKV